MSCTFLRMVTEPDILADIEAFLKAQHMTPTAFGRAAFGDPKFVFQVRDGRRLWPQTEQTARDYMRTYQPKPSRHQSSAEGEAA